MTTAARIVLEDCRGALAELGDGLYGGAWRRRWIAAVTLLRAVGHVLAKVNARTSPQMEKAIQAEWELLKASKPEPKILMQNEIKFFMSTRWPLDRALLCKSSAFKPVPT